MLPREARSRAVSAGLAQGRRPIADGEVSEVRYGFEALPKAHSLGSGSNQIPSFLRNRRSSYLAVTDLTSPIPAEALSMSANNSSRFHNERRSAIRTTGVTAKPTTTDPRDGE